MSEITFINSDITHINSDIKQFSHADHKEFTKLLKDALNMLAENYKVNKTYDICFGIDVSIPNYLVDDIISPKAYYSDKTISEYIRSTIENSYMITIKETMSDWIKKHDGVTWNINSDDIDVKLTGSQEFYVGGTILIEKPSDAVIHFS